MDESKVLEILKQRFETNPHRHPHTTWTQVEKALHKQPQALFALEQMEHSGGEPDVLEQPFVETQLWFVDCSAETPMGRRNATYDGPAEQERVKKGLEPNGNAVDWASHVGVELVDEETYRHLQTMEPVDQKTSSWILTPPAFRARKGALFMERRYQEVFLYHNGAASFYQVRGFRVVLKLER
ncbi:MAG: DUF4256 domain-containing protein [Erysipelotrichaceae bacterium]